MRKLPVLLGAVFLSLSIRAGAETIVITGATAHTMTEAGPIENATIVIEGGLIAAIGEDVRIPEGARRIDAEGQIVTPGLMNSGTHLGLIEISSLDQSSDYAVRGGPLGAAFNVKYALNPNSTLIPVARADGLTRAVTVPEAAAGTPFDGVGAVLHLGQKVDILDVPEVAMFATFGGSTSGAAGGSRSAQWILIRNALEEARHYRRFAKTYETAAGRDQLLNRLNIEALQPLIEGKLPLAVTAHRESDIRQAIALGEDYDLRIIILGATEAWRLADLLAERQIPVVVDPFHNLPENYDELGARLDNAAVLEKAGVPLGIFVRSGVHMSHVAGLALRHAAGLAVANGMSWEGAMRAITTAPARIWGLGDRYGTLAQGREADIVIWSGDPLEIMSAPERVFIKGEEVSLETRQTALRKRYTPQSLDDPMPPAYR